jgi:hypothetical protein
VTGRPEAYGRRGALDRPLLAAALAGVLLAACQAPSNTGTLELRYVLPAAATAGLVELQLEPDWAGANQSQDREENYQHIPLLAKRLTLPAAGDAAVPLARGEIPAGAYNHVFSLTPRVTGRLPDGSSVNVTSHIEPIARGFEIGAGETVTIDIELIVLPRGERFGGGIEIFVKDARVVPPPD